MTDNQLFIKVEREHDLRMKVFVPWQRKDWIQKIRELPDRAWNKEERYWSLPKTVSTLTVLKSLFGKTLSIVDGLEFCTTPKISGTSNQRVGGFRKVEFPFDLKLLQIPKDLLLEEIRQGERTFKVFVGDKIRMRKVNEEWLQVWVAYDKREWIGVIKDIDGRKWHVDSKSWVIPYVKDSLRRLWKLVGSKHIQYDFKIKSDIPDEFKLAQKQGRKSPKFPLNDMQQRAITAFEEKLMLEHKAWRTRKTYVGLFRRFLTHFPEVRPSSISREQIEKYIIYKKQENVSDSQLNQLINCLNCFYIRILKQEEKVVKLERPKKKKKLPNVFSLEEVEKLLKVCVNLKHKCMLILIYSGGLRRSEVLNLRVNDLHFDRKTLFIKNAKGGKDRFTFFSDVARKYLKTYLTQYEPRYYLFEGQYGGRYGESSIQKVFDEAKKKAKVLPNVSIHGLRHSFATHLIEKRVPLHVVQELLGHNSIKTTEIYLHISNKFRAALKSPLDDLKI